MDVEKAIAKVGDEIIITDDNGWESGGFLQSPYPLNSKWKVRKVIFDEYNPHGVVYCEDNMYGISYGDYEVINKLF